MFAVVTSRIFVWTRWFTVLSFTFYIIFSIFVYVAYFWISNYVEAFSKVTGTIIILQKSQLFWFALVLCVTACFCGDLVLEYIKIEFTPNASDFIRNFVNYKKSLMKKPD